MHLQYTFVIPEFLLIYIFQSCFHIIKVVYWCKAGLDFG